MDFEVFNDEVTNCNDLIKRYEFESCPLLSRCNEGLFYSMRYERFLEQPSLESEWVNEYLIQGISKEVYLRRT